MGDRGGASRRGPGWALLLLTLIALAVPGIAVASTGRITDLGAGVSPRSVNDADQVVVTGTQTGLWTNGTVTTPSAPASDANAHFTPTRVNDAGVVAGLVSGSSHGPLVLGYWDSGTSSTFSEIVLTGLPNSAGGTPYAGVAFPALDNAGEMVATVYDGTGGNGAGIYIPAVNGLPTGTPTLVTSLGGTAIHSLFEINDGFELAAAGSGASQGELLYNRATHTGAITDVTGTEAGPEGVSLAEDGSIIGWQDPGGGAALEPVVRSPGGADTRLPPGDTGSAYAQPQAIGANDITVGRFNATPTSAYQVLWDSGGSPTALSSLLPAGSGWDMTQGSPAAINQSGDIAGIANSGGASHGYLLQTSPLSVTIQALGDDGKPYGTGTTGTGSSLTVKVTVAANAGASGPITGISVNPALTVSPSASLTRTSGPTPAPPSNLTLQPGQSTTYTLTYAVAGTGDVTLNATATGTAPGAVAVQADGEQVVHLTGALAVSVGISQYGSPLTKGPTIVETAAGPQPQLVSADVTVKNTTTMPITNVTLPANLTIGWHLPANGNSVPVTQVGAPALNLGTLAPGASQTAHYTLQVGGDGSLDVQALVLGSLSGTTVKGFGTTLFSPDSQLLVLDAQLGAVVHSQRSRALVQAGTQYLVKLTLTNRSFYRKLALNPLYAPGLVANAGDGHIQDAALPVTSSSPTGSLNEVAPTPGIELSPQETKHFLVVVRTAAQDPFDPASIGAATRSTVTFGPPTIHTVDSQNKVTDVGADHVLITPGSGQIDVHLDQSQAEPSPFNVLVAAWSVTKGVVWGLWRVTSGVVRGVLWDLPVLAFKGVRYLTSTSLYYMDRVVELWTACDHDRACLNGLEQAIDAKILAAYDDTPYLLTQSIPRAVGAINTALDARFTRFARDWYAGDWQGGLTDITADATDTLGNAALLVGPAVLARFPKAAAVFAAAKDSLYAKVATALRGTVRALEPAGRALTALKGVVKPGFWFTTKLMARLFGVDAAESAWLKSFTAGNNPLGRPISVVLRSRAAESLDWIKKGGVLKPFWIKTKNVSWLDVEYLGYRTRDVGRIVLRQPEASFNSIESRLAAKGIGKGNPLYTEVYERWSARVREFNGEWKDMERWNKSGKVKGKWPWQENGVDPRIQADHISSHGFRLIDARTGRPSFKSLGPGQELVPQIFNAKTGQWASITGDIDLIAITNADGSALNDYAHVRLLKALAKGPLGAQHPESTTWVKNGQFWFKAKEGYLTNDGVCCMAQYGPDGRIRAVEFNHALSDPTNWTKLNYRIFWNGGYQAGPGL